MAAVQAAGHGARRRNGTLAYIPTKMKEEMKALHLEDGSRWSASTLAARFGARRENVAGLLKLVRAGRKDARRGGAEGERLEKLREEAARAWREVKEGGGGGKRYGRRLAEASRMEGEGVKVRKEEKQEKEGEQEVMEMEEQVVRRKSATAVWVEGLCERAEVDVKRRTSFAFIEVGGEKGEDVDKAVWIREGASGKLRVAEERERDVLLQKVRVVDSGLWT